jgi:hypothetical protein
MILPISQHRWWQTPRWVLPLAGAVILAAVVVAYAAGLLGESTALITMAVLTVCSVVVSFAFGGRGEEDRRADLPLAMAAVWALFYLGKTDLLPLAVQVATWPAYILFAGYAILHDYPLRWVLLAFVPVLAINLAIVLVFWRP